MLLHKHSPQATEKLEKLEKMGLLWSSLTFKRDEIYLSDTKIFPGADLCTGTAIKHYDTILTFAYMCY